MATTSTNNSGPEAASGILSGFFHRLWQGLEIHMYHASRRGLIEQLEAKSDEELATLGIRRENITSYVFRDMFYA